MFADRSQHVSCGFAIGAGKGIAVHTYIHDFQDVIFPALMLKYPGKWQGLWRLVRCGDSNIYNDHLYYQGGGTFETFYLPLFNYSFAVPGVCIIFEASEHIDHVHRERSS